FVETVQELRTRLDEKGYKDRQMIAVGDGSYCNKRTFTAEYDRTILLTRCRKNLRLRDKKTENAREFQPLDILKDQEVSWQKARIFYAGSWREIEYKEMKNIFW